MIIKVLSQTLVPPTPRMVHTLIWGGHLEQAFIFGKFSNHSLASFQAISSFEQPVGWLRWTHFLFYAHLKTSFLLQSCLKISKCIFSWPDDQQISGLYFPLTMSNCTQTLSTTQLWIYYALSPKHNYPTVYTWIFYLSSNNAMNINWHKLLRSVFGSKINVTALCMDWFMHRRSTWSNNLWINLVQPAEIQGQGPFPALCCTQTFLTSSINFI